MSRDMRNLSDKVDGWLDGFQSIEKLQQEQEKLEDDLKDWEKITGWGSGGSDSYLSPSHGHMRVNWNAFNTNSEASYTLRIFGGREGGLHADSQGLSKYKEILRDIFHSQEKSQCETTMAEQRTKLDKLIEDKKEEIALAEAAEAREPFNWSF